MSGSSPLRSSCPRATGWVYEPKYDGFRAVVFVDGDECS